MSIFSFFNFKEKFQEVFSKENLLALRAKIRESIIERIKINMPGQAKMDIVKREVTEWAEAHLVSSNKIVQWIIDVLIIPNIEVLIQAIYDDLKETVKGL